MGVEGERGYGEAAGKILEMGIRSGEKYTEIHDQKRTGQR